ncbi:hypothetical protein HAX54_050482, partial [Datura stramonium]|nr:hypothetical protein [Datura stramonium]
DGKFLFLVEVGDEFWPLETPWCVAGCITQVGGRLAPAIGAGKAAPHTCHCAACAPRRALSCVGRPVPRAWNRTTQGLCRASSSTTRPVPRTSGRAAVA